MTGREKKSNFRKIWYSPPTQYCLMQGTRYAIYKVTREAVYFCLVGSQTLVHKYSYW